MYKLIRVQYIEKGGSACEHCGHGIKTLFFVRNEAGEQMIVGSECVRQFIAPDQLADADKLDRRIKRAIRQFRANQPPRKPGESRQEYVDRRVQEYGRALIAAKAWAQKFAKTSMYQLVTQSLEARGLFAPWDRRYESLRQHSNTAGVVNSEAGHEGNGHDCPHCAAIKEMYQAYKDVIVADEAKAIADAHAAEYGANAYDFNRPIWEVRKI